MRDVCYLIDILGKSSSTLLVVLLLTARNVISGIIWSEELDKTFRNNYKIDPTLSWQYFGSSTGFMRQFPGIYTIIKLDLATLLYRFISICRRQP